MPAKLLAVARRPDGLRDKQHIDQNIPTLKLYYLTSGRQRLHQTATNYDNPKNVTRVAMDLLDMSVTTARGNRYVLVMVDCFTRWTEAFPLPDKTAQSVADAFFNQIVCRFGMPSVMHSDQGREFENKIMQKYVCWVAHIKQGLLLTTRKVMGWLNVSIELYS